MTELTDRQGGNLIFLARHLQGLKKEGKKKEEILLSRGLLFLLTRLLTSKASKEYVALRCISEIGGLKIGSVLSGFESSEVLKSCSPGEAPNVREGGLDCEFLANAAYQMKFAKTRVVGGFWIMQKGNFRLPGENWGNSIEILLITMWTGVPEETWL